MDAEELLGHGRHKLVAGSKSGRFGHRSAERVFNPAERISR